MSIKKLQKASKTTVSTKKTTLASSKKTNAKVPELTCKVNNEISFKLFEFYKNFLFL